MILSGPSAHNCCSNKPRVQRLTSSAQVCEDVQKTAEFASMFGQILGKYLANTWPNDAKWAPLRTRQPNPEWEVLVRAKMWYTPKPSNYSWKDTMGFTQCSVSLCKPFSLTYSYSQLLDWLHMWPGWYPCSAFRNGGNDLDCTVLWTVLPSQFIPTSYRLQTSAAESVWIWGETQCWTDRSTSAAPATSSSELRELVLLRCSLR